MANNLNFTVAARNNMLDELTALIDAGTAGLLRIYDGTQAATADTAVSGQTLLAELTMSATSFTAASSGAITANEITPDSSAVAGTASWFRIVDSAGNAVIDGTVGTSGSDLNLNSVDITNGINVEVTSLVLTAGNI